MIVYTTYPGGRLGDNVFGVSNAILVSKRLGRKINYSFHEEMLSWEREKRDYSIRSMEAALSLFDYEPHLNIVDHLSVSSYERLEKYPIGPLAEPKLRWSPPSVQIPVNKRNKIRNKIAYGVNATSARSRLSEDEEADFLGHLSSLGLDLFDCHSNSVKNGLADTISKLYECGCFVGSSSGFTCIASAIRMPVHLLQMRTSLKRISVWHAFQEYVFYNSVSSFTKNFRI